MKAKDLRKWIASMTQDIDFEYNGIIGSICPFSENDIALAYGDVEVGAKSVEEAMNAPLIDGKSLNEMAEFIDV